MPKYHVNITEMILRTDAPAPTDLTPEVRMVDWTGDAADNDAAVQSALRAWDEKYGPDSRPAPAQTRVRRLNG